MVDGKFTESMIATILFSFTTDMPIVSSLRVHGNQIGRQRQNLIDHWADKGETDWLLWVDSDVVITPNILTTLCNSVEKNNIEIISGVYFISKQTESSLMEPLPCIFKDVDENTIEHIHPLPENELIKVDCAGMGLVLMNRSVINKLRKEFLEESLFAEVQGVGNKFIGEDIVFFRKVKEVGIQLYAHTGALAKHIKRFSFDENFYKMYWDNVDKITQ
jgi:hypothetical protein